MTVVGAGLSGLMPLIPTVNALEECIDLKINEKLENHKSVLVVELKPDNPNLIRSVEKVKPYLGSVCQSAYNSKHGIFSWSVT